MEILQSIDFTQLILSILGIIAAVAAGLATKYFIPWLKAKFTDSQINVIKSIVEALVQAAEQIYEDNEGEKKKAYVLELAQKELDAKKIKVDVDALSAYIESAVLELKAWLKK